MNRISRILYYYRALFFYGASVFLFCIGFFPLQAEIVTMKDGTELHGRIVGQTSKSVRLKTAEGVQTIEKSNLKRIRWVKPSATQKQASAEELRQKKEKARKERERIAKEELAKQEKERLLKELEAQELEEKKAAALERAERAAALRELVETEKMEKPKGEPISYWDFAWRSLLIPGWGHFKIERPVMGSLYLAATAGYLYGIYNTNRIAKNAIKENDRKAEENFIFSIAPGIATKEIRIAYSMYANAKALTVVQKKVDNYNHALYLAGVFYGFQLLHIIYNGFAWEKGLLIVDNNEFMPKKGSIRPHFAVIPQVNGKGQLSPGVVGGFSFYF